MVNMGAERIKDFCLPSTKGDGRNPISSSRFLFHTALYLFFMSIVFLIFLRASPIASTTMGPKRVRLSQEQETDQIRRTMSFYLPRGSRIWADELKGWVADETNEHRATLLMDAKEAGPRARLDACIFAFFLMAGVVPPLSLFLHAVLEE
jgi:hypothetical protein